MSYSELHVFEHTKKFMLISLHLVQFKYTEINKQDVHKVFSDLHEKFEVASTYNLNCRIPNLKFLL